MKKLYKIGFIIIILISAFVLNSCDSSEFEETELNLSKDTIIYKYDTVFIKKEGQLKQVRFDITVQLASFSVKANAEKFAEKTKILLEKQVDIISVRSKFIVIVGRFSEPEIANSYLGVVKSKGIIDAYVRNIKEIY